MDSGNATPATTAPHGRPPRHPAITRACLTLDLLFLLLWAIYLLGPDVSGILAMTRGGTGYRLFSGAFFALHFVLITTGIIALFVVIIEVYARRPVRGLPSVLWALGLPIASFLYFATRYLMEVERFLHR
ncbi:MAG TPA: hypothetical protein VNL37_00070 [Candidatus Polarisedimenticolia bacterium]|nr:hypothetical protein [Candidatus Polarisedimenticolia bacterium]